MTGKPMLSLPAAPPAEISRPRAIKSPLANRIGGTRLGLSRLSAVAWEARGGGLCAHFTRYEVVELACAVC